MKSTPSIRRLAERLIQSARSTVLWTRSFFAPASASGIATETAAAQIFSVPVVPLGPGSRSMIAAEWWQSSTVRLAVAATKMPFVADPVSGVPQPAFEDTIVWAGNRMRVLGIERFDAPGRDGGPVPYLYFIGLGT